MRMSAASAMATRCRCFNSANNLFVCASSSSISFLSESRVTTWLRSSEFNVSKSLFCRLAESCSAPEHVMGDLGNRSTPLYNQISSSSDPLEAFCCFREFI